MKFFPRLRAKLVRLFKKVPKDEALKLVAKLVFYISDGELDASEKASLIADLEKLIEDMKAADGDK